MKLITLLFSVLITSILYSSCCKKDPDPPEPPQLTPKTTTGAETLSFLKDGEVWIADKDALSPVATIALGSKQFSVASRKRWDPNQREGLVWTFVLANFEERLYTESDTLPFGGGFSPETDLEIYCLSTSSAVTTYESFPINIQDSFNYVDIKHIDWSGNFNIISGTFQFRMISVDNDDCQDTVLITDGRFDLEFDVIP